ncbi:MAG TPA: hypothetical protein VIP80_08320 [Gemmatimonadales bacterium]|jgi:hypothetical protein
MTSRYLPALVLGSFVVAAAAPARWSAPGAPMKYEVQLAYTGYTGLAESSDCRAMVDTAGYDSLTGTLTGIENPAEPDEDVVYTGTLGRVTRIDYCQTRPGRSSDQVVWCKAKLTGAASMNVELTVYGEDGNGGWLKAKPARAPDSVKVQGSCLQADMDSIKADYPNGESAGSPDGQPIAEPVALKLVLQGIRRLRQGYFPPDPPRTAWGLRVVRVVP